MALIEELCMDPAAATEVLYNLADGDFESFPKPHVNAVKNWLSSFGIITADVSSLRQLVANPLTNENIRASYEQTKEEWLLEFSEIQSRLLKWLRVGCAYSCCELAAIIKPLQDLPEVLPVRVPIGSVHEYRKLVSLLKTQDELLRYSAARLQIAPFDFSLNLPRPSAFKHLGKVFDIAKRLRATVPIHVEKHYFFCEEFSNRQRSRIDEYKNYIYTRAARAELPSGWEPPQQTNKVYASLNAGIASRVPVLPITNPRELSRHLGHMLGPIARDTYERDSELEPDTLEEICRALRNTRRSLREWCVSIPEWFTATPRFIYEGEELLIRCRDYLAQITVPVRTMEPPATEKAAPPAVVLLANRKVIVNGVEDNKPVTDKQFEVLTEMLKAFAEGVPITMEEIESRCNARKVTLDAKSAWKTLRARGFNWQYALPPAGTRGNRYRIAPLSPQKLEFTPTATPILTESPAVVTEVASRAN